MGRTLVIRSGSSTTRGWIHRNFGDSVHLQFEPDCSHFGTPCRFLALRGETVHASRFFGSLRLQSNPLRVITCLTELAKQFGENVIISLGPLAYDTISIQIAQSCLELVRPEKVVLDKKLEGLVHPTAEVELSEFEEASENKVEQSKRKAQWLKFRASLVPMALPLAQLHFAGSRMGVGTKLSNELLRSLGLPEWSFVRVSNQTCFVITNEPLSEGEIGSMMDVCEANKVISVLAQDYKDLLCCLYDAQGRELGMGLIQELRLELHSIEIQANTSPGTLISFIRLGQLAITEKGAEKPEVRLFDR